MIRFEMAQAKPITVYRVLKMADGNTQCIINSSVVGGERWGRSDLHRYERTNDLTLLHDASSIYWRCCSHFWDILNRISAISPVARKWLFVLSTFLVLHPWLKELFSVYKRRSHWSILKLPSRVSTLIFCRMWNACEEVSPGRIRFAKFLDNLGIDVQPGDLEGPSTRIHDESNEREAQRLSDQSER